jgi:ornithine cyclodeaminase/alanine dehydrogenase-like protein (mu-crystallin family)
MSLPFVPGEEVERRVSIIDAADALERALLGGLDPEEDPAREVLSLDHGQLLVMPSGATGRGVVKLVTAGGEPHIQGVCVVFDTESLAPVAIALTKLRTPAISMTVVRRLASPEASRLLVFGRGPQGQGHAEAVKAARPIEHVDVVGSDFDPDEVDRLVETADVICCCTTAGDPLFNGELVQDHALVIAVGSHDANKRELDAGLLGRSSVVVESRTAALREAGDVVAAIDEEAISENDLVTLADLVRGKEDTRRGRPQIFKSVGMAWADAVVAAEVLRAAPRQGPPS